MPCPSTLTKWNTHTLFKAKKYAREANGISKMDGNVVWPTFGLSETPVSALSEKIHPRGPKFLKGAQRPSQRLYRCAIGRAFSEASTHEPIPGNFPNDFGKI